jgi:hypothetical protein
VALIDPQKPQKDSADAACRVCGSREKLSFEHVPPKSVGNRGRVEMLGIDAWLSREDDGANERGKISQRGSGAYSLCNECNNRAGSLYVPELAKWTGAGNAALHDLSGDFERIDAGTEPVVVHLGLREVCPGRFMKQLTTMLLALSSGEFPSSHPDLANYARDPQAVGLPDRYQFYLAFLVGPTARFNGGAGIWRENGGMLYSLELGFPPYAYILTIDEEAPALDVGNITGFAAASIDQVAEIEVDLRLGFSHTPLPLDFRTKGGLERDREANEAEAKAT